MTRTGKGIGKFTVEDLLKYPNLPARVQADLIGCSVATVFALRREASGSTATRIPRWTPDELAPYAHLSFQQQLDILGCSNKTLSRLRKELGIAGHRGRTFTLLRYRTVQDLPFKLQLEALRCGPTTLVRLRKEATAAGIEVKARLRYSVHELDGLDGLTIRRQAEIIGCSHSTVVKLRRRRREAHQ